MSQESCGRTKPRAGTRSAQTGAAGPRPASFSAFASAGVLRREPLPQGLKSESDDSRGRGAWARQRGTRASAGQMPLTNASCSRARRATRPYARPAALLQRLLHQEGAGRRPRERLVVGECDVVEHPRSTTPRMKAASRPPIVRIGRLSRPRALNRRATSARKSAVAVGQALALELVAGLVDRDHPRNRRLDRVGALPQLHAVDRESRGGDLFAFCCRLRR